MVVVATSFYFLRLDKLLKNTPKKVLANYIYWSAVASSIESWETIEELEIIFGLEERRSEFCAEMLIDNLPLASGALYARRYFNHTKKQSTEEIIDNLIYAFRKNLKTVSTTHFLCIEILNNTYILLKFNDVD